SRMLRDIRSQRMAHAFADRWLQLGKLDNRDLDDDLRESMRAETHAFVAAVIGENRDVREFLNSKDRYLNETLAKHYGVAGVTGPEMRRVNLDPLQRRGLLSQASVLTLTSPSGNTLPVKRGKWILESILGEPPPPRPAELVNAMQPMEKGMQLT